MDEQHAMRIRGEKCINLELGLRYDADGQYVSADPVKLNSMTTWPVAFSVFR